MIIREFIKLATPSVAFRKSRFEISGRISAGYREKVIEATGVSGYLRLIKADTVRGRAS